MTVANDNDARLPLRMPGKVHRTLRYLAKAKGTSMNDLILGAVYTEIDRLKEDEAVMSQVRGIIEEERDVLGDLSEPSKKTSPKKRAKRRTTA